MKVIRYATYLLFLVCLLFTTNSCKDEATVEAEQYGYLQFCLEKAAATKGITDGAALDYLKDAKKLEVTLLYDNNEIKQSLNVLSSSGEGAEYQVRTEKIKLRAGSYTLTGYKIFGDKIVDGKAQILQEGLPDEEVNITLECDRMHVQVLAVATQHRGRVSFLLKKDFSEIPNLPDVSTKGSSVQPDSLFNYYNVKYVEMHLQTEMGMRVDTLTTGYVSGDNSWSTDTLVLNAGKYTIKRALLMDDDHRVVLVVDPMQAFSVVEAQMEREAFDVTFPANSLAIRDYIALYNIWRKMKGESWYCVDDNAPEGANWVFDNRPVDDWGQQPLVDLHPNGRVMNLNLGAFNAKGMVPDEIGELTALQALYLGTHSDRGRDPDQIERIDMYKLSQEGVNLQENRMAIHKERLALRFQKEKLSDFEKLYQKEEKRQFSTVYAVEKGEYTNSITGISPAIAKCKSLTFLFVANGMVKELPVELGQLKNLSDIEIYNCPQMEKFPVFLKDLTNLVALNFSKMPKMNPESIYLGASELFNGPSNKTLQILYFSEANLEKMPLNMQKLVKLGLLDLSYNRIETIYALTNQVSPVQVYLESNRIGNLPDDFCNIDDIETFSMQNNRLKVFPNTFNKNKTIYKIKTADFSMNQLETFASNFEGVNIESLNFNENNFGKANTLSGKGTFPSTLSDTESAVSFLQIGNNAIDTLSFQSIENLKMMSAFDLKGNRLEFMPSQMHTGNFAFLTGLDLSNNSFSYFPVNVLNISPLLHLVMSGQSDDQGRRCLKEWPERIEQHFNLRVLDISGNDIRQQSSEFPSLLNMLNVSDNPNIRITMGDHECRKILEGRMQFIYDKEQFIEGCPQLVE